MQRILLPTDFSENASHALRVAATLAARVKAKLELIHINTAVAYSPPLPEYYGGDLYDTTEYYETAARELHNIKKEVTETYFFANSRLSVRTMSRQRASWSSSNAGRKTNSVQLRDSIKFRPFS